MLDVTKKEKTVFICNVCGYQSLKWLGRCPDCGLWESLQEERSRPAAGSRRSVREVQPCSLTEVEEQDDDRSATGIGELDRVLGGGIVPGSVILLGGDPGIGKSTLILQMLSALAKKQGKVLYVSGEESARQIRIRARRLSALHQDIFLATENAVETIVAMTRDMRPGIVAIDSIQTMSCEDFSSAPGSVSQVRESAARLVELAKRDAVPVVLVGHVTKEGILAGPRVLEHMVDTVLSFEGDRSQSFRIVRTVKNRFGSTNEIGVFEMKSEGLIEVENPSEIFLAERPFDAAGSVVLPSVEGTRPILVEVQALVSPTSLGTARRTAIGADSHRLALLCAVLEKKAGMDLYGHDIFLNIAGGVRIDEPALDLGVICALASSMTEKVVAADTVVCGEVGLAGEVRGSVHMDMRLNEAERLGFRRFVMPGSSSDRLSRKPKIEVIGVATIQEALKTVLV